MRYPWVQERFEFACNIAFLEFITVLQSEFYIFTSSLWQRQSLSLLSLCVVQKHLVYCRQRVKAKELNVLPSLQFLKRCFHFWLSASLPCIQCDCICDLGNTRDYKNNVMSYTTCRIIPPPFSHMVRAASACCLLPATTVTIDCGCWCPYSPLAPPSCLSRFFIHWVLVHGSS